MSEIKEMYSNYGIGLDRPMRVSKDGIEHEVTFSVQDGKAHIHAKNLTTGQVQSFYSEAGELESNPNWFQQQVVRRFGTVAEQ